MNTLNPTIALVQAPIDIWREASSKWKFTMDSITWIEGAGVGVIKK